jgi:hypothetical protein
VILQRRGRSHVIDMGVSVDDRRDGQTAFIEQLADLLEVPAWIDDDGQAGLFVRHY